MSTLLNIREFSAALGVPVETVRKWCFYRLVPFVKLGKSVRFRPETLTAIQSGEFVVSPMPSPPRRVISPITTPIPAPSTGWIRTLPPAA